MYPVIPSYFRPIMYISKAVFPKLRVAPQIGLQTCFYWVANNAMICGIIF